MEGAICFGCCDRCFGVLGEQSLLGDVGRAIAFGDVWGAIAVWDVGRAIAKRDLGIAVWGCGGAIAFAERPGGN